MTTFIRVTAGLLLIPLLLLGLMAPYLLVYYPADQPLFKILSLSYDVAIIVIAAIVFLRLKQPTTTGLIALFSPFPILFAVNPVELALSYRGAMDCDRISCVEPPPLLFAASWISQRIDVIAWEFGAFFLLLLLLRIAAAKDWPGKTA